MIPSLFIMGTLDVIAGFVLLGLNQFDKVDFFGISFPHAIMVYMGVMILLKGVYSISYGFVGQGA